MFELPDHVGGDCHSVSWLYRQRARNGPATRGRRTAPVSAYPDPCSHCSWLHLLFFCFKAFWYFCNTTTYYHTFIILLGLVWTVLCALYTKSGRRAAINDYSTVKKAALGRLLDQVLMGPVAWKRKLFVHCLSYHMWRAPLGIALD